MKLNVVLSVALCAVVLSSGLALANHHEGAENDNKEPYKSSADTNKDGKLTYEEYKLHNENRAKNKFDHMDANKDGTLDEAELKMIYEMGNNCDHHNMPKDHMHQKPTDYKT